MGIFGLAFMLLYLTIAVGTIGALLLTPVYLVLEAVRVARAWRARSRPPVDRGRRAAELELREQYAAGVLSLVGLEERLEETLRARSHFELESVLEDLPRRPPRVPRVVLFEVAAGVGILLVSSAVVARVAGAALAVGALAPPLRWRPVVAAFLAGLALLLAPLAALPLAASAAWRFVSRTE